VAHRKADGARGGTGRPGEGGCERRAAVPVHRLAGMAIVCQVRNQSRNLLASSPLHDCCTCMHVHRWVAHAAWSVQEARQGAGARARAQSQGNVYTGASLSHL
jgi:hypothetical protein